MTKTEFDKVDLKLSQARSHLASLRDTESSDAFYLTVNAFLAASRSVLSVLSYQFGLKELSPSQQGKRVRASLSPSQKVERQRFDAWMASAGAAALAHPLREERDESAHRSGQTGFGYHPKPGPGIVLHSGNAFQPARVLYAMGRAGLPMSDRNTFSYGMDDGSQVDAIAVCQDWLSMIEDLVTTARSRPW